MARSDMGEKTYKSAGDGVVVGLQHNSQVPRVLHQLTYGTRSTTYDCLRGIARQRRHQPLCQRLLEDAFGDGEEDGAAEELEEYDDARC